MPVLTAAGLGKSYGPIDIFSDISLSVPHRARIGLVGNNGVGKTTLLRVLVGIEEASTGVVQVARGVRIGYLPQEAVLEGERTVWQECLEAFTPLLERQAELADLEHQMRDPHHAADILDRYGKRQREFELAGGYTYENRLRHTLMGLGFAPADFDRPLSQLSGGQRTRTLLAKLLLTSPELLLLDEPTNHLDIEAIEWLETYLKEWDGAAVIVSHDRYFLDRVVDTIWEMTPALEFYHGNYSAYLTQRAERYKRRMEEYEAQQELTERESEYISRNMAGQNTRQAQGRLKRLERLLETARAIKPFEPRKLHLRLEPVGRSGDLVLRTYALSIGYADEGKPLFYVPDLILRRGECAAILGPNGAGKTTFLKTLLGQVPPLSGEALLGANLQVGYFAQAHEGLHPEKTLIDEISALAPQMRPGEIRNYLAQFLFTGDDVFKTVEVLSGGEHGRLALACLALSGANLLLLDEPTNHLDLASQDILQTVLAEYRGTILLVSHDRYLIDALATQIWEVQPDTQSLRVFEGTYSEYRLVKEAEAARQAAEERARQEQKPKPRPAPALSRPDKHERRRLARMQELEAEISDLENRMAVISRALENPPADLGKVQRLGSDYVALQHTLEERMQEWGRLADGEIPAQVPQSRR
ncbi:MAG TPA: ABC-F family ATP-binding cassette domain-containing protein [Anaerolineaceae bacterium]